MINSEILKSKTQQYHNEVENIMQSKLIFSKQYTIHHYEVFLQRSYNYISNLIHNTTNHWDSFHNILLQKQKALEKDLYQIQAVQNNVEFTAMQNICKYQELGFLYIVLGAMMGNKIIKVNLSQTPAFSNFTFNYLSQHQEQLPQIWQEFKQEINSLTTEQLDKVIAAAIQGYQLYS